MKMGISVLRMSSNKELTKPLRMHPDEVMIFGGGGRGVIIVYRTEKTVPFLGPLDV